MLRSSICHVTITGVLFGYGWGYDVTVFYMSGRRRVFSFGGEIPVSAMVSMVPKSVHDFIAASNHMTFTEHNGSDYTGFGCSFLSLPA